MQMLVANQCWNAIFVAVLATVVGCSASQQATVTFGPRASAAESPAPQTATAEATPSDDFEPTPVPTLGSPWSPASAEDTALADRVGEIWTDNDADAAEETYESGAQLVTGWSGVEGGLDRIWESVAGTPNTYTRASGVTVTTQPVPGLWLLPPGGHFLHWITQIHGSLFDTVLAVNDGDSIVVHWAYECETPDVRVREGFPAIATPEPAVP